MLLTLKVDCVGPWIVAKPPLVRWIMFVLDVACVSELMMFMAERDYTIVVASDCIAVRMVIFLVRLVATWEHALAVIMNFMFFLG